MIIPDIVISELNNLKDRGKPAVKQKAWLVMSSINNIKDQITISKNQKDDGNNDEKIADVATRRAKAKPNNDVYLLSDDIYFQFLCENVKNLSSITPQVYAEQFTNADTDCDPVKSIEFISLIKNKDLKAIKDFNLHQVDVNYHNPDDGFTPLITAVRSRSQEVLKYVLSLHNVDIDKQDKHKYYFSPVHHATQLKNLSMLKTLAEYGADIDLGSGGKNAGNTPLMISAWSGFDLGINFFLELGAYRVSGQAKNTLVFIHGWSCDGRYWQNQISEFSKDYKVITIDLAGHGHSSTGREKYSMNAFGHDVKAVIEKENIENAILVGHSMGGAIIAEAASLMPEKIVGIIGVDALQNVAEQIPQHNLDNMKQSFENDFKTEMQNFVSAMFPANSEQQLVNWVKEDMSSAPKEIALDAFQQYLGQYVNGEAALVFKSITVPVVSINARLWPTSYKDNSKHIKDYQLYYIENTGHFPMLEKPGEFNLLLKNAINDIESK